MDSSVKWRAPNFYIIGCPKCGTTALANFLGQHPNIYFSPIKEPWYHLDESVNTGSSRWCDYQRLFNQVNDNHVAIGEGSTFYIFFIDIIQKLLSINSNSKFIVMIRNPIDATVSAYCEKFKNYDKRRREISLDFNEVWNILPQREKGLGLPKECLGSYTFRYDEHYRYGKHLTNLLSIVPRDQILILIYDDFKEDCIGQVAKCYEFLDVSPSFKPIIQYHNVRSQLKNNLFISFLSTIRIQSYPLLKRRYFIKYFNAYIRKYFSKPIFDIHLNQNTKQQMKDFFYPELKITEKLIERNLLKWLDER